jgi:hypothetical protein
MHCARIMAGVCLLSAAAWAAGTISGRVVDTQGGIVPGARVKAGSIEVVADPEGRYRIAALADGVYELRGEAADLASEAIRVRIGGGDVQQDVKLTRIAAARQSIEVAERALEPQIDLRNAEVFERTLFTRDDQVLQQMNAGIDAGQHEGGGKSVEIRRFGFNLDHGGVNGGLKVMLDGVQQNQGTQGHGQGYLGSLKALSPELIEDVTITNGPFSAEYGDFSGLGVVHIHQRESLGDQVTVRLAGGNFNTGRGFLAYSPELRSAAAYVAYEGSYTDGPFRNPSRYRRDNLNANYTRVIKDGEKLGFRAMFGRNDFYSSGQVPVDAMDRFGYIDPSDGGRVRLGTVSAYFTKSLANGDTFRADGFVSRSLFDLYSNFTFFLNDPVNGDAFQQHDSRLQQGLNAHYAHVHRVGSAMAVLTAGGNFHDNEINVGLYPREGRVPTGVTTRADARVTNGAGYAQESLSLWRGRLLLGGGVRFDAFRYDVADRVDASHGGMQVAGRWQGKGNAAFTPSRSCR